MIGEIAAAAIGGGLSYLGGESANAANAEQAKKNRQFQERMRATQYQTAVEDMRKAGINPAMAYHQGGAGTPTGATAAPMQNTAEPAMRGVAGAVNMAQAIADINKTKAETNQISIESASRLAAIDATIANLYAQAGLSGARQATEDQTREYRVEREYEEAKLAGNRQMEANFMWKFLRDSYETRLNQIVQENDLTAAHAGESRLRTRLGRQDLQHDWFTKKVSPFINDAGAFTKIIPRLNIFNQKREVFNTTSNIVNKK